MGTLETPEVLFAAYRALKDGGAPADAFDALAKRTKSAKAAWTKAGDREAATQLAVLQGYLRCARPVEPATPLRPDDMQRELDRLTARHRDGATRDELERGLLSLVRRLAETRSMHESDPSYDADHDAFVGIEESLFDLARAMGLDLDAD